MRQPRHSHPPFCLRLCPVCGLPMFLSEMEGAEMPAEDRRTFACQERHYAETVAVQFATRRPDDFIQF